MIKGMIPSQRTLFFSRHFARLIGTGIVVAATATGCSTSPTLQQRKPAEQRPPAEIKPVSRDEVMGPNRARLSVKAKSVRDYIFRNVASAFPDTGKNMLLKDRTFPKDTVTGALDHSPWHLRTYNNPDRNAENQARFSNVNKSFYSTALSQKEAELLSRSPKKLQSEPFYQSETGGQDDSFEPNNSRDKAFDLSNAENRWISLLGGKGHLTEGVQWDEDWFRIRVSPHYRRLMLDLRFQHYLGDVDMKLYDGQGNLIATSQGSGDDEFIHLTLNSGGVYYVQIYGANHGNRYDFKFSTFFTGGGDDEYEDNDRMAQAFDLRPFEGQWLSEIRGEGVAADDDYYLIRVPPGKLRVLVDLRVDVDRGDVDIRLLNSQGKVIASSANITDDDFIDFTVPAAGNYYLKVYPFSPQSAYNLYDLKWITQKISSQSETSKSLSKRSSSSSGATR